ncbi:M23 family metallopeptidase [Chryseobacterium wangxinyae]|uniref:M23 family metallopeptidase n=1 Tax=Chryseobacterium sp. CY353 TaxID=2997334 RepID=UPI00226DCD66|nr:M23 family metallopeptidase [Chryseobacterium sp. CY353]MCY0967558.1 M23 family metallopeptidase [Chryseobacterium sp. CY353]
MKRFLGSKKKVNILIAGLLMIVFAQSIFIAKLYSGKDDKNYEVNLVKINTEKDSVDYLKMKTDLGLVDQTVGQLNSFLKSKDIKNEKLMILDNDSISNSIYLAKQSNRYSQYLMDLQKKLQQVPLGMPTEGYISSNFGIRKNPIPFKTVYASVKPTASAKPTTVAASPKPEVKAEPYEKILELTDSYGNKREVKVMVTPKAKTEPAASVPATSSQSAVAVASKTPVEKNNPPAEADQMQYHKGLDIAVPFGSDVIATAAGTVIFSGQKGGYGNCVIVSHGNGLATLYGHLSKLVAKTNDKVKVGQVIAKSGNSGRSTGPHLHYEVHKNNTPVNPKLFMNL